MLHTTTQVGALRRQLAAVRKERDVTPRLCHEPGGAFCIGVGR